MHAKTNHEHIDDKRTQRRHMHTLLTCACSHRFAAQACPACHISHTSTLPLPKYHKAVIHGPSLALIEDGIAPTRIWHAGPCGQPWGGPQHISHYKITMPTHTLSPHQYIWVPRTWWPPHPWWVLEHRTLHCRRSPHMFLCVVFEVFAKLVIIVCDLCDLWSSI